MEPLNQKHWLELEREAAELVAARFSFTWEPSPDKFDHMDGHFLKDGKRHLIAEIKVSDKRPAFFHTQGYIRLNGAKIRRGRAESCRAGLPFVVVFYAGRKGVFVWRITDSVGIDTNIIKFTKERRPIRSGHEKVLKEIARLEIKNAYFFCK